MLQQLQLVAAGIHVDEIDNHHPTDIAQLQLAGNLHRRFAVGPQHRFPGIGGAGEGARVDVDDGERLGGLDDDVTTGGQVDPGLEGIADRRVHLECLEDLAGFWIGLHQHIGVIGAQEGIGAGHRLGAVHHHPHQLGAVEIPQHAMDEVFVAVQQHGRIGRLRRLLNRLPLA